MPFTLSPYHRFPVQCAVSYNAGGDTTTRSVRIGVDTLVRSKTDSEATQPLNYHYLAHSSLAPFFATLLEYSSLRGSHALHASSIPSVPCAMRCDEQRWHIPQAVAGLLFGFGPRKIKSE